VHKTPGEVVGTVRSLFRYPVKSMLGEALTESAVTELGLAHDRRFALIDTATGRAASAKAPVLWRALLGFSARIDCGDVSPRVVITLPDGEITSDIDDKVDEKISRRLDREVHLAASPPPDLEIERARPDEVLAQGVDAQVTADIGRLGRASPQGAFFDYAPLHLITTSGLAALAQAAGGEVETARYRPNLVIDTGGAPAFMEDAWVGREVEIGPEVRLRVLVATPRCAVPTLAHGDLPQRADAMTALMASHLVTVEGRPRPCLGVYSQVLQGGVVRVGDEVRVR
jgi:uncharacterized protein